MPSLNKVFLMGNLTREPELRYTPSGAAVCEFGLAVNRKISGSDRDDTCFVDITVWEKQAENCSKYLQKGAPVFIEGRLQYDQWVDKEQKKRSRLRVLAERVQFLNRREDSGNGPDDGSQGAPAYRPRRQTPQEGSYEGGNGGYYNRRSTQGSYGAPQGQRDAIPPQAEEAQMSYEDVPPQAAPAPRRQASAVPPPPPPPEEGQPGVEDDIPF